MFVYVCRFGKIPSKIENAWRHCHMDGRWDNYTNYDLCQHLSVPEFEPGIELPTIVYYTGYTISLVSLSLAVAVFFSFKWVETKSPNTHFVSVCFANWLFIQSFFNLFKVLFDSEKSNFVWFFFLIFFICFTSFHWKCRDLRCLRNTIHANLFLTHILSALLWILTLSLQVSSQPEILSNAFHWKCIGQIRVQPKMFGLNEWSRQSLSMDIIPNERLIVF